MSQPRISMPSPRTIALLVVIVLVVLSSFVALPISPTLKASFRITTPPQSPPTMEIVDSSYSKTPLLGSTQGNITISYPEGTQGYYSLTIVITYGDNVLSSGSYSSLGDGLYQMYVVYFPRFGEQSATPYSITFSLSYSNGIAIGYLTLPIYPT